MAGLVTTELVGDFLNRYNSEREFDAPQDRTARADPLQFLAERRDSSNLGPFASLLMDCLGHAEIDDFRNSPMVVLGN